MSITIDGNSGITPLAFTGNLQFTQTGQRITGDFSNLTVANRVMFQSSTANTFTQVGIIPSGTGTYSVINTYSASDPTNSSYGSLLVLNNSDVRITSGALGTGTNLPMTFFTGGAESMRLDSSGRLGIGTASPIGKLDVQGGRAYFASPGDAFAVYLRYNNATQGVFIGSPSANAFQISSSGGGYYFNIDSSGNVGIGTNSPFAKASVEKTGGDTVIARYNSSNARAGVYVGGTSGAPFFGYNLTYSSGNTFNYDTTGMAWWVGNPGGQGWLSIGVASGTAGTSAGTDVNTYNRLVIDTSGNVGIGTSSPVKKLDVIGSGDTQFRVGSSAATSYDIGRINSNGYLQFYANQAVANGFIFTGIDGERMRIDSSGNVGIGTSSPSSYGRLAVMTPTATYGYFGITNSVFGAGGVGMAQYYGTTKISYIDVCLTNGTPGSETAYMAFATNNAGTLAERMRIDSSGNVGIGTSSQTNRFEVSGPRYIPASGWQSVMAVRSTDAQGANTGAGIILGGMFTGSAQTDFAQIAGLKEDSTSGNYGGILTFYSRPNGGGLTERMRIDSSGNVGIGTATPTQALAVSGAVGYNAPVTNTAATYTVAATDNWIICNRAGTVTVTLPTASSFTGRIITIKTITANTVVSASSNVVPSTSATAGTAILAATAGKFATLVSDGTNWVIMQAN